MLKIIVVLFFVIPGVISAEDSNARKEGVIHKSAEWIITDDGKYAQAENEILRVKFARNAKNTDGWFKGGGGQDGGIVELYYKPCSDSRNLVFRNGAWGGKMDALDYWEAEDSAVDGADHNAPDFASTTDAVVDTFTVYQSAGRLFSYCEFKFKSWSIKRTYILYPWGDITVHSSVRMDEDSRWNYLGHRFHFGVSRYILKNHKGEDWGGNYQDDGEFYYAFSDVYGPEGKYKGAEPYMYKERIVPHCDKNTAISMFNRYDPYSGFLIDDTDGDDPDIMVINGDSATWFSPFERIARSVGGHSYIESGIYTPPWAPKGATHADMCWFYATVKPPAYSSPMLWKKDLGAWDEMFHVFLRRDIRPEDYMDLWRAKTRGIYNEIPYNKTNCNVYFNEVDRSYHIVADTDTEKIDFSWKRNPDAPDKIDYRTFFVIENIGEIKSAYIYGANPPDLYYYYDAERRTVLVVLTGKQNAQFEEFRIELSR